MMQNFSYFLRQRHWWKSGWLIGGLMLSGPPSLPQLLASGEAPVVSTASAKQTLRSLESVLIDLEAAYRVSIVFDHALVENKQVEAELLLTDDLEASLSQLLRPFGLESREIEKGVYVIKAPAKRRKKLNKLKQSPASASLALPESQRTLPGNLPVATQTTVEKTITGQVTDLSTNETLPGVNILVKGTTIGTITDVEGNYRLTAPDDAQTLVFSSVGYTGEEIEIGTQTVINLEMAPDIQSLSEVVVVGYGTQKKSDLTGAIAQVSSEDFEEQPLFRTEDALQGRAAGVQVQKNTGAPGGDIKIRIRGTNSITGNNDPLIVIDGIIGGDLASINTNDIASMDVLKDASATAIYGSRGANGVILITTKRGSTEPKVDLNYFVGVSEVPKKIDVLSPQQFAGIAGTTVSGNPEGYQDLYFQTGITHNAQLSTSGKEGRVSYFVSGNYVDQEGIAINTGYDRFSLRSNLSTAINDKLSVGLNLYGSRERTKNLNNAGNGLTNLITFNPAVPVRGDDGEYNLLSEFGSIGINPIAFQETADGKITENRFNANLNISYDIFEQLNFTILAGSSFAQITGNRFNGIPGGSSVEPPRASSETIGSENYQLSNILTWSKGFGVHNLKLMGIYELQSSSQSLTSFSSIGYVLSDLRNAFYLAELGEGQNVGADYFESAIQSYIGRAEYDLASSLFLTATVRVDQSSRFREGNNTGVFPSFSAAYSLRNLDFIQQSNFVNNIKLRAGYGVTGNQDIRPYSTFRNFNTGQNYSFDGLAQNVGLVLGNPVDENLTWETTSQINIGADFLFLKGRLNVTADWFKKNTNDLLLEVPLPRFTGGGSILRNVGEVQNTGVELVVSAVVIEQDDFTWNSNLNVSTVNNEVLNLGGLEQITIAPYNIGGREDNLYVIKEGEPLGQFYGATFLGTYKSNEESDGTPGSAKYLKDEEGGNVLGLIGNGTPNLYWGFNNTLTFKGFDFNVLVNGSQGFDVLNATRGVASLAAGDVTVATHADFLNRWTPENETDIPATGDNIVASSRYIEDGSFVRVSNVSIGYNFPQLSNMRLKVYVSAQNALLFTNYSGYDPEVSSTGSGNFNSASTANASNDAFPSLDFGALPNPRTFTIGVNVGI